MGLLATVTNESKTARAGWSWSAACLALLAWTAPAHALTITSVSGSTMQIDIESNPALSLLGGYEGYRITTGEDESYDDLWVVSDNFAGPQISLATNEDGIRHLGPIAENSSLYVYFYLVAQAETAAAESHRLRVFNGPVTGTPILTQSFSLTAVERGPTANNKITVITHTPSGPGIGGTLVMTIRGSTGTMTGSNPNVYISPASRTDWPANVFELEHVISRFDYLTPINYAAGTYTNEHFLTFGTGDTVNVEYEIIYTFRIVALKSTTTAVQPVNYLASGGQMKHTQIDGNDYTTAITTAGAIPQPEMHLQLTRDPISPGDVSLPASGGTVVHRQRVTNDFTEDVVIDDITDVFVMPHATPTYVAASATLTTFDGASSTVEPALPPMITVTVPAITWRFTEYFVIPAGGYIELAYTASYPSSAGTYTQQGTAHVSTTQIDTTLPASVTTPPDDAPAVISVSIGDSDGDGVADATDLDTDNDGIADLVESGLAADPDADADTDGVANFRDPNFVTCTDTTPANGVCDALPASIDADGDALANHLDLDSDGDGVTDAFEADSGDADGDGVPDDCTPVTASGQCAGGSVADPRDIDGTGGDDFLDTDSDGDGISDRNEAFDTDGDGASNVSAASSDSDGDGIDDAFDLDCALAADCGGVIGTAVTLPLAAYRDQNGDGAPDWLQSCGDAYEIASEGCDDGDLDNDDACSNACLLNDNQACIAGTACVSGLCDAGLDTCQPCVDDTGGGTDSGCSGAAPTCTSTGSSNSCVVCDDSSAGIDDGCGGALPDFCVESLNGGLGGCVECLGGLDCDDGEDCTTDSCTGNACAYLPLGEGLGCSGGVCDGGGACVRCVDDAAEGATDSGCSEPNGACVETADGGLGLCFECTGSGAIDCDDGNDCTSDSCASNSCDHDARTAGVSCDGTGVCNDAPVPICVSCIDDEAPGATDSGCDGDAPACNESLNAGAGGCVDCSGDADCPGQVCVAQACVPCENDQPGDAVDHGCAMDSPYCDAGLRCIECVSDGDCDTGELCNPSGACAPGCNDDDDCEGSPGTPLCNVMAQTCVECLDDTPCADTDECTADLCVDNDCVNPPAFVGTECSTGVCDGEPAPSCVFCVDNQPEGETDPGCDVGATACDESAGGGLGECVPCLGDDDCDSGVCFEQACVACEDDQSGDATDRGCDTDSPLCDDSDTPACVECLSSDDCGVGEACDDLGACVEGCSDDDDCVGSDEGAVCDLANEVCVECLLDEQCEDGNDCNSDACNDMTHVCDHAPLEAGIGCGTGVCDGASACVICLDLAPAGTGDPGCADPLPACDPAGNGNLGECVACRGDADCAAGVCDAQACVACDDDQLGSAIDRGCDMDQPLCDDSGTPLCVECLGDDDCGVGEVCGDLGACIEGCSDDGDCVASATGPVCDVANETCVECMSPSDCDDGDECTQDACDDGTHLCSNAPKLPGALCSTGVCDGESSPECITCVDDAPEGEDDSGCGGSTPACDTAAGECVTCLGDADCGFGVCADSECTLCEDDQPGDNTDHGCGSLMPYCDDSGSLPICLQCESDDDCEVGTLCNPSGACTPGCDGDEDCTATPETPLCETESQACVACLVDSTCDDGDECTADECFSNGCVNEPELPGKTCSGGVCDGLEAPSCTSCVDDQPMGAVDLGCTSELPACDDEGSGECVACTGDADCSEGVCAANACTPCEDDQTGDATDHGCGGDTPLCNTSGETPVCVECAGDGDCGVGALCNPSGMCAPGCSTDDDCASASDTPVCEAGAQVCVECIEDDDCPGVLMCGDDDSCGPPDSDGDGVTDDADEDDDNDGVADADELGGSDLSLDADDDGVPDYGDPDAVTCDDSAPADGRCDELPEELDLDADGVPSHLDRDSDGDGLSDALEAGAGDDDGDGIPDNCLPVTASGACSEGSVATPPDTDETEGPDFLDTDSDGDGVADHVEAFDDDGDGDADIEAVGSDSDGDGIDDAFDADCALAGDCAGTIGAPVTATLTSSQDENGDDTADWLQLCGDAYVTGGEACDDGDLEDGDACDNACLRGMQEICTSDAQCASSLCDTALGTCEGCLDDADGAIDTGCSAGAPICATANGRNACVVCADSGDATDDGCSGSAPACDADAAGGLGACVGCLDDDDCNGGLTCGADNTCESSACERDADCVGIEGAPACDTGNGVCVACTADAHCPGHTTCNVGLTCVFGDNDGDGLSDDDDIDDDADGVADDVELGRAANRDDDADGVLDFEDPDFVDDCTDDDGDGACDALPEALDADGDGRANHLDADADGDGIPDANEGHDADFDGEADRAPAGADSDGDGLDDAFDGDCASASACAGVVGVPSTEPDLDEDDAPSYLDADDDADARSTRDELRDAAEYGGAAEDPTDIDGDGRPNWLDPDSDGDGASDEAENANPDADDNGIRDALDPLFRAPDEDGDGLLDVVECPPPAYPADDNCPDTDGDGTPDYQDLDSDDDRLSDADELENDTDPLDPDTDGDGLSDGDEVHDYGTDPNIVDTDGDGVEDGQEVEEDTDPLSPAEDYSLQGGSLFGCSAAGATGASHTLAWLALGCAVLGLRRRRARASDKPLR